MTSLVRFIDSERLGTIAVQRLAEIWISACDEFRRCERREIIEAVPSVGKLSEYLDDLKWIMRSGRAMLDLISDPEYPESQFVPEIRGKLLQLESSLKSLNNAMTEAEAEEILKQAFLNDPLLSHWSFPEHLGNE
jgi:Ca2+-binding EF-hand superfamily protein